MDVEVSDGRIHAEERGSGTPILIMHGGGLDHRHMVDALEPVFDRTSGWHRIYIDLPGHGLSRAAESVCSQDHVLAMISTFIDVVLDGTPCAVIGESRGSYHAMGLAHTRPDDLLGMMLIVAGGMSSEAVDRLPAHRVLVSAPEETAANATPEARARFARLVDQRPDILEKIERTKVPATELADTALAQRISENFKFGFDLSKPRKPFDRPCLLLNGRQDALAGYRDMMDAIDLYPRATLTVLDCAGHSLAWEQPEIFAALTLEWLDRVKGLAPG